MDELFCDQSKAYESQSAEPGGNAVTTYEQFREAVEQLGKTLAADEELLAVWHDAGGGALAVEQIGYYQPNLIVFRGRDASGAECTALVPAHAAQLVLKKVKKTSGESGPRLSFVGHTVTPEPPAAPPK